MSFITTTERAKNKIYKIKRENLSILSDVLNFVCLIVLATFWISYVEVQTYVSIMGITVYICFPIVYYLSETRIGTNNLQISVMALPCIFITSCILFSQICKCGRDRCFVANFRTNVYEGVSVSLILNIDKQNSKRCSRYNFRSINFDKIFCFPRFWNKTWKYFGHIQYDRFHGKFTVTLQNSTFQAFPEVYTNSQKNCAFHFFAKSF